jgi:hypothetical protein
MKLYTPKNVQTFQLSASDFLTAAPDDWRAERLAETYPDYAKELARADALAEGGEYADAATVRAMAETERERAADELAGFYWWTCSPGCMPESDASGPFATETEAIEDAGGGHYEDYIFALADELGEDPAEFTEEKYDYYGLTVVSHGRAEYAVGTDAEADEAWDQSLDSYIDDAGLLDSVPENLRSYFDRDAWKSDARHDGRGHSLASYDGEEMDLSDGFYAYRIN